MRLKGGWEANWCYCGGCCGGCEPETTVESVDQFGEPRPPVVLKRGSEVKCKKCDATITSLNVCFRLRDDEFYCDRCWSGVDMLKTLPGDLGYEPVFRNEPESRDTALSDQGAVVRFDENNLCKNVTEVMSQLHYNFGWSMPDFGVYVRPSDHITRCLLRPEWNRDRVADWLRHFGDRYEDYWHAAHDIDSYTNSMRFTKGACVPGWGIRVISDTEVKAAVPSKCAEPSWTNPADEVLVELYAAGGRVANAWLYTPGEDREGRDVCQKAEDAIEAAKVYFKRKRET